MNMHFYVIIYSMHCSSENYYCYSIEFGSFCMPEGSSAAAHNTLEIWLFDCQRYYSFSLSLCIMIIHHLLLDKFGVESF